jgi:DNA-binding MarR family transcriptional regulator
VAEGAENGNHSSVEAWAKHYYFSARAEMESVLRPYDLGTTQWQVLSQLVNEGPTMQRDLARLLHIERATLSGVVATLVRKELADQTPSSVDLRQRVLRITNEGIEVWKELPDPLAVIRAISFEDADPVEVATALRVLESATQRLNSHMAERENQ